MFSEYWMSGAESMQYLKNEIYLQIVRLLNYKVNFFLLMSFLDMTKQEQGTVITEIKSYKSDDARF